MKARFMIAFEMYPTDILFEDGKELERIFKEGMMDECERLIDERIEKGLKNYFIEDGEVFEK